MFPKRIEIDITYNCNLKCINCNRMCKQIPSKEEMSTSQIYRFVEESMNLNIKWDQIRILGGEPTLHTDLNDILHALLSYQSLFSPLTNIILFSNNYGSKVKRVLSKIPNPIFIDKNNIDPDFIQYKQLQGVIIANHWTKGPDITNLFVPINDAPIDDDYFKTFDFSKGCKQIYECGIGLTPYGYYPCSVAGAIDRVCGYNLGIKKLSEYNIKSISKFCSLCGMFKESTGKLYRLDKEIISDSWKNIFSNYNKDNILLTRY